MIYPKTFDMLKFIPYINLCTKETTKHTFGSPFYFKKNEICYY